MEKEIITDIIYLCKIFARNVKNYNQGKFQEIYNIASDNKYKVIDVIKMISIHLKKDFKKNIKYVNDRPFNDKIYKINCNKLKKLNWKVNRNLKDDLPEIIQWYKNNKNIFN